MPHVFNYEVNSFEQVHALKVAVQNRTSVQKRHRNREYCKLLRQLESAQEARKQITSHQPRRDDESSRVAGCFLPLDGCELAPACYDKDTLDGSSGSQDIVKVASPCRKVASPCRRKSQALDESRKSPCKIELRACNVDHSAIQAAQAEPTSPLNQESHAGAYSLEPTISGTGLDSVSGGMDLAEFVERAADESLSAFDRVAMIDADVRLQLLPSNDLEQEPRKLQEEDMARRGDHTEAIVSCQSPQVRQHVQSSRQDLAEYRDAVDTQRRADAEQKIEHTDALTLRANSDARRFTDDNDNEVARSLGREQTLEQQYLPGEIHCINNNMSDGENEEGAEASASVEERCALFESIEPTISLAACSAQAELLQTPRRADASASTPLTPPSWAIERTRRASWQPAPPEPDRPQTKRLSWQVAEKSQDRMGPADASGAKPVISPSRAAAAEARRASLQLFGGTYTPTRTSVD